MEELAKKYLSFYEEVLSATLLNPDFQSKVQALAQETMAHFTSPRAASSPTGAGPSTSSASPSASPAAAASTPPSGATGHPSGDDSH